MTEAEKNIEFAKQFDNKDEAARRAKELGSRWHVCKSFKQKGKFQLSYEIGYAV